MNECRSCHNKRERERHARLRRGQRDAVIASFVTQLKSAKSNDRVAFLCGAMIQHFRGLEGFLQAWRSQLDRACQQQPGSKKVLDFFRSVVRLIEYCDATRPSVSQLPDEDLHQELAAETRRQVEAHPQLAIEAAAQLGWTVVPPTEGQHAESPQPAIP